jgi:uncharacterized protein YbgA (DUF1722 family)
MTHSTAALRELGRLVTEIKEVPRSEFRERYANGFMAALARLATPGRNANTLRHAAGYLEQHLDSPSRSELADLIHEYRNGRVPLVVPVTLIAHHARQHEIGYLRGQTYLEPHSRELMLRNHV